MIYLVSERWNAERRPRYDEHPPERWLRLSLRLGCYQFGLGRDRLLSLGLTWDRSLNLLTPSPVVGEWDTPKAFEVARLLLAQLAPDDEVLMLGRREARAFGMEILGPGQSYGGFTAVPHPSGLNRWWNDPANLETFRCSCTTARR